MNLGGNIAYLLNAMALVFVHFMSWSLFIVGIYLLVTREKREGKTGPYGYLAFVGWYLRQEGSLLIIAGLLVRRFLGW